jgi:hypothetical protein
MGKFKNIFSQRVRFLSQLWAPEKSDEIRQSVKFEMNFELKYV